MTVLSSETTLEFAAVNAAESRRATLFNDRGMFYPTNLANELMSLIPLKTRSDSDETFFFDADEGIWRNADVRIKQLSQIFLREKSSVHYITETAAAVKRLTYFDIEKEKPPNNLIPLANGVFDIDANDIKPYSQEFFFVNKLPVAFKPDAICPKFHEFINQVLPDPEDVQTARELIAYSFFRSYCLQKAFMLVGEGANGKSTFLNVLTAMLGKDNVANLQLQDICDNRFAASGLIDKYANICPDIPASRLQTTGLFKALTGGDRVFADRKHLTPVQFWNTAKLIFSANQLPKTSDETTAFMRRWVFLQFPVTFSADQAKPNLINELTTAEELSGVFNWSISCLKPLIAKGMFNSDKKTDEVREFYLRRSDSIAAFVLDCLELGTADDYISKELLFNTYAEYCRKIKTTVQNKIGFGRDLPKHIVVNDSKPIINGVRTHAWSGIRFKSAENIPIPENNESPQKSLFDEK